MARGSHLYLPLPVRWWCLQKNWSHLRSTHSFWPSAWSVPKDVPGLTWCACLFDRHQASSSCVAMAARWCAARVRAFRRRRSRSRWSASCAWASRSSAAPRRRAADAVAAAEEARREGAPTGHLLRLGPWAGAVGSKKRRGQQDPCKWVCEAPQPGSPSELARLVQAAALAMNRARRCLCDHEITLEAKAPAAKH